MLVKRGYIHSLPYRYIEKFCLAYRITKYGEKKYDLLSFRMIKYSHYVSFDINNEIEINDIVVQWN